MLSRSRVPPEGRGQSGFTLIEVLIALLLLSFGLLGLAGLQTLSLRNNGSALMRSRATLMAYDILDSMRADVSTSNPNYSAYTTSFTNVPSGSTLADTDLIAWKNELAQLPGGEGAVAVSGSTVTVSVRWLEKWDKTLNSANNYQLITFTTQL